MMPPPADDASPLTLRDYAARFTRNDAMLALCVRRHISLPQATSCEKHASFARQSKHHSKTRDLLDKSRVFAVKDRVKVHQTIERTRKSTPAEISTNQNLFSCKCNDHIWKHHISPVIVLLLFFFCATHQGSARR